MKTYKIVDENEFRVVISETHRDKLPVLIFNMDEVVRELTKEGHLNNKKILVLKEESTGFVSRIRHSGGEYLNFEEAIGGE